MWERVIAHCIVCKLISLRTFNVQLEIEGEEMKQGEVNKRKVGRGIVGLDWQFKCFGINHLCLG